MKIFVDSADVKEIKALAEANMIDGVTTNPSLIAQSGQDIFKVTKEICEIIDGPVSSEVIATSTNEILKEAEKLMKINENIVIKLPTTFDGLAACSKLSADGALVNMTLCFSASQALLAARAGAIFVSPFVGRLDDAGQDGMGLISEIIQIFDNYQDFDTEVLVASVRNKSHIVQSALLGADAVTAPPKIIRDMVHHDLTDQGLEKFLHDWKQTGQKIK